MALFITVHRPHVPDRIQELAIRAEKCLSTVPDTAVIVRNVALLPRTGSVYALIEAPDPCAAHSYLAGRDLTPYGLGAATRLDWRRLLAASNGAAWARTMAVDGSSAETLKLEPAPEGAGMVAACQVA